ncbi:MULTISPECIES: phosphoenolpyruvate--protein phosphotransferase [unclassified Corynebacterium]|jgi:phosphoenolpyruvate-protein phosphotransferase|uniref:phosphoenolpyruvate--protein phosphotransferase n=1 Tax=unclassified Corynebacterium TaxID=2624378 RepID=UPI001EF44871|nr:MULTISPECIES: phosphoenolpyruvate--protein phosphotransferase [unclassified Corynebacterium]MCG7243845.1 phosphoenolpyruvate--protein phosphotransferase [Corynebacterium sp. ACRPS]MCG7272487.1 phosphoenolpyruvate--protein phosphotransferase [Corynebacterium sp. ACRQM]MCG7234610.1 phosphoenolpyruvate--protein phosphotransferase [Corynebacterium sp. ACRPR]MDK8474070.1 phosphoenolpyruvate--protein phosphotransferase [Corynebacterium sp. MSK078]MDK8658236.1 phosphoenolpyruvate--protein phosphot
MENTLQSTVKGTGVVAGVAYAEAVWVRPRPELPTEGSIDQEASSEAEYDRFLEAVDVVASRLENRAAAAEGQASEVLTATAGMVKDRGWHKAVRKNIRSGKNAEFATVGATDKFVTMFEAAGGVMAERTTDLKDVRDRVIAQLRGEQEPGLPMVEGQAVLFADDLAPADTATLDTAHIRALVTELGGPTSHTAIIARQLDIPCIVAVGNKLREIESGTLVFVDGALGTVTLGADEEESTKAVEEYRERAARVAEWTGPTQTKDGRRVQLLANVADGNAARIASDSQAEGIGLYRTELSFLSASEEPSVDEQAKIYKKVFNAYPNSKVVVRTLDAGSDKPISYATLSSEENPALGVRGLRIARDNESLLTRQLDAIAQAAESRGDDAETWVMAPMVATSKEAQWFAELCRERGLTAGAMIEVPAAALMADKIMPHLDFVSIGTNDLTQYTMAADRLSPQLAYLTDPWQPAVLRLIQHTCIAGHEYNVPVGVCGEAAADPLLACVLTGLGVNSLSAASTAVAGVGAQLAELTFDQCQQLADAALNSEGPSAARAAAMEQIEKFN